MMQDLYKETVDFQITLMIHCKSYCYADSNPEFIVNGASGIAVGMLTNMPTHNLSAIDACIAYIDNNDIGY